MLKILIQYCKLDHLMEYSNNYSEISGSLWQHYKDITAVNTNANIVDVNRAKATDSFN